MTRKDDVLLETAIFRAWLWGNLHRATLARRDMAVNQAKRRERHNKLVKEDALWEANHR